MTIILETCWHSVGDCKYLKTLDSIDWARNHKILITPDSFYLPFLFVLNVSWSCL